MNKELKQSVKKRFSIIHYWKPLAWAILIGILSLIPTSQKEQNWLNIPHLDKLFHLLFYSVLSFLLIQAQVRRKNNNANYPAIFLLTLIMILFYGIILEIIQEKFIPTRKGDVVDVFFNTGGFLLAGVLFILSKKAGLINKGSIKD